MNEQTERLKYELFEAVQTIRMKSGIPLRDWRELFDYGSSEWDSSPVIRKKEVLDLIKGRDNPLMFSLEDLIRKYMEMNRVTGKESFNKSVDLALMEIDRI